MADQLTNKTYEAPFRPRARMLRLLGDELIGSPRLAVFELVKNAYDADANEVTVRLDVGGERESAITISDDGEGMSLDTIRSVWLVPGHDHRRRQRRDGRRSPRHKRLPLGEKGVGRFAVHKLGDRIRLTTRAEGSEECVVNIDWNELTAKRFLDEALVKVSTRSPRVFTDSTGTRIEIRQLRPPEWTRGEVRRLCNQITSICSPFEEPGFFRATLFVPGREHWIEGLPDFAQILNRAFWRFRFSLKDGRFDCDYTFRRVPGFNLEGREVSKRGDVLKLPRLGRRSKSNRTVADAEMTQGIGPISGEFFVFDRDREVLRRLGNTRLLTQYLDEQGGIRVYRDGIRVYNYGEKGDDWLGLDLRRVNIPTRRISRNIILGAVHLSVASSVDLVEKTNREGFVENEAFERLWRIVLGLVEALEEERQLDKERLRKLVGKSAESVFSGIEQPIRELRSALDARRMRERFEPYVAKIERGCVGMQDTLLTAGMSGLNLAVVFHEVERGVRMLHDVIVAGTDIAGAQEQARHLMYVLDGFSTVLRRDPKRRHRMRKLLRAARQFSVLRLQHHRVRITCRTPVGGDDFESQFSFGLVLGALNNLLDNSLYWMRIRWPDRPPNIESSQRRLFLGVSRDLAEGPAIVVADNGPGFQDTPEYVTQPFFTRKPDGMGLGLYYANLAMELNGGRLAFPAQQEVDLPEWCDGAVVAMVFKGTE